MAATDATPVAIKNQAYRHYFCIRDAAGAIVTGWTGQDSERSLDGATMADCTNEATEIATSSGCGYLELTATEMNTSCTTVKVTVTNTDALDYVVNIYPVETGDLPANIKEIDDSATAATKLSSSADTIVTGAAEAGTLSTTQMTTDLAEATDDHYNGRVVIWTSGTLTGQASSISDYQGSDGMLTYTAVTEAPSAADTFVIV